MKNLRGLTLIELLTSIAIVATLMGVILPGVGALVERNRVAAAHNLLLATFQQARTAAITSRRRTVVCPSDNGARCVGGGVWEDGWIAFIDQDRDGSLSSADTLLRHENAGIANILLRSSSSRPMLRFRPDGRSAGSNVTIRLCNSEGKPRQAIIVNNGGRSRRANNGEIAGLAACS